MSLEGMSSSLKQLKGNIHILKTYHTDAYAIAVKHGFEGTEAEWLESLKMSPEEVDEAVAKYIEENPVAIDDTLTEKGKAADAKATGDAIRKISAEAVNGHIANKENPHNVTAKQVGLGNVNNTSDMDKPVSTAQKKAIVERFQVGTVKPNSNTLWFNTKENLDDTTGDAHIMAHDLNMGQHNLYGVPTPTGNDHAANMGYVNDHVKKAAPRNLLDNSDFTNPVNQRGVTSFVSEQYGIDRWVCTFLDFTATVQPDGLHMSGASGGIWLKQIVPMGSAVKVGAKVTMVLKQKDKTPLIGVLTIPASGQGADISPEGGSVLHLETTTDGNSVIFVYFTNSVNVESIVEWAALYEGEYTEETLPEYQPKGYGAELAECQRYYRTLNRECIGNGYTTSDPGYAILHLPFQMRMALPIKPTIVLGEGYCRVNGNDYPISNYNISSVDNQTIYVTVQCTGAPAKHAASFYSNTTSYIDAEL